jgi:pilus assembly protein CpaC
MVLEVPLMNRLISGLALGALVSMCAVAASVPARAQEQIESLYGGAPRRISMGVGKAAIVDLPEDASEIFVANPKIANAVVRTPRKLYLIGMEAGQTSVFALDRKGNKIAALELSIGRDIGGLQQILRAAMPSAAITARTVNDTIILTGTVDSPEEAQRATDIANGFVQRLFGGGGLPGGPPSGPAGAGPSNNNGPVVNALIIRGRAQVMLKVTIAEISREIAKQLGLTASAIATSWATFTQFNPFPINGVIAAAPVIAPGLNPLAAAAQNGTASALTAHNNSNSLSGTLQAFERYGVTRILAEPTVTAISGEAARLTVGGELPVPGPPSCTNGGFCSVTILYKDYGVSLRFTPVVLAEGRIELHVAAEVTDIDNNHTSQTINGFPVYGFLTRKNETTVEIPSGGSIASAGLLQTASRQAINGLPGLLDLPILGTLFRSRDYQRQETELLIVITPYIVKPAGPHEIAKPTDGFADASDPQAWFLGRMNRLYASPANPEALKDYKGPVGFIRD